MQLLLHPVTEIPLQRLIVKLSASLLPQSRIPASSPTLPAPHDRWLRLQMQLLHNNYMYVCTYFTIQNSKEKIACNIEKLLTFFFANIHLEIFKVCGVKIDKFLQSCACTAWHHTESINSRWLTTNSTISTTADSMLPELNRVLSGHGLCFRWCNLVWIHNSYDSRFYVTGTDTDFVRPSFDR